MALHDTEADPLAAGKPISVTRQAGHSSNAMCREMCPCHRGEMERQGLGSQQSVWD